MTPQQMPPPAATERRQENLALSFQELLTVGERLRSHRQQVGDANAFREQTWEAVKIAQGDALKRGYNGDDIELALFAVVAYLDESILVLHAPVFADWARMPLQQQRYGHDIAGEVFFQNLQKILTRSETHELADLLEVYHLCLLLGFAGRYSVGGRGELASIMQATADKIRRIRSYAGLEDVPGKLGIISANDSLCIRLFWVVSTNTGVNPRVKAAFQPSHIVVPADSPVLITDTTRGYMTALNGLQLTIQGLVGKPLAPASAAPIDAAGTTATQARYQATQTFPVDQEAQVDKQILDLLQDPFTRIPKGAGNAGLNAAGRQFCAGSGFNKFPFNPKSPADATLPEANDIFRPKEGALWRFIDGTLKQYFTCTASGCTPIGNAPLTPTFVAFTNEAVRFSKALYGDAGTDPALKYTMTTRSDQVDTFTFTIDGNKSALKSGQSGNYTWSSSTNKFGIGIKIAGVGELPVPPYDGLWAPFRFFADADSNIPSGANYTFVFKPRVGQSARQLLEYQVLVDTHGAPAVFSKNFWQQLRCIPTVAK